MSMTEIQGSQSVAASATRSFDPTGWAAIEADDRGLRSWLPEVNVGSAERLVSITAGAILTGLGISRRDLSGMLIAGVGGGLLFRGATGHCLAYEALGIDTSRESVGRRPAPGNGFNVAESFLIGKSSEELYELWRNFENLPHIMSHLESVRVIDERRSHWVATAPRIAGGTVEWDAEITADEPNRRIAWQSLPGADVDHWGSVEFVKAPGDRGTKVRIEMEYRPPAGQLGRLVAKIFGDAPEQQIREDLRRFKRVLETGEAPTTDGQPRGSCMGMLGRMMS
jgi:uncharacterized membrane protein